MSRRKRDPLRPLTDDELSSLTRLSRSQVAPAVEVARAKIFLAVAAGGDYQQAARLAGRARPPRGQARADARGRRDGDLVAGHPEEGAPIGSRWASQGRDLDDLAGLARGRTELPAEPHLVPDRGGAPQAGQRHGGRHRSRHRVEKKLIEDAYRTGEAMGLPAWCTDQAGPFQTIPYPGQSWQPEGEPARQPHEYLRDGTAKVLTLFHPADGQVRVEGVTSCPNTVLHGWLKQELAAVLASMRT